jgi:hypothetical protein
MKLNNQQNHLDSKIVIITLSVDKINLPKFQSDMNVSFDMFQTSAAAADDDDSFIDFSMN